MRIAGTNLDPEGIDIGEVNPNVTLYYPTDSPDQGLLINLDGRMQCTIDGTRGDCALAEMMLQTGAAVLAPEQTVAPIYSKSLGQYVVETLTTPRRGFACYH